MDGLTEDELDSRKPTDPLQSVEQDEEMRKRGVQIHFEMDG